MAGETRTPFARVGGRGRGCCAAQVYIRFSSDVPMVMQTCAPVCTSWASSYPSAVYVSNALRLWDENERRRHQCAVPLFIPTSRINMSFPAFVRRSDQQNAAFNPHPRVFDAQLTSIFAYNTTSYPRAIFRGPVHSKLSPLHIYNV